ncbi:unnamed protein product [Brassica oleracea]
MVRLSRSPKKIRPGYYQSGNEGSASQMTKSFRSWRGLRAPSRAGMFY